MGYSLVTELEKEEPQNEYKPLYKKSFSAFFWEFDHIFKQAFPHQLCGPLSVAPSVKYLVLLLITANK